MGARFRSWWQKRRKPLAVIGFIAALVVVIALIFVEVRLYGTGFAGKALWDWLQLLVIPAVLAIGGYVINLTISRSEQEATKQRAKTEQEIASDNQREMALQDYIDKMSELLLDKDHPLRESAPEGEVRKIARVRTLTVLPRLNKERKSSVLQFLYESGLIETDKQIIDLRGANLSGANLGGANLSEADFRNAQNTTDEQLNKARLLKGTIMPDGSTHP